MSQNKYEMTISPLTVDKLGVKLYDKVSAVIAELIANAYDADATEVTVEAPMATMLASRSRGINKDSGYKIVVQDNGCGMSPEEINDFYLMVGGERRKDKRGDRSAIFDRPVMGRKGIGKLAPFGICETIEVISSGGDCINGIGENGQMSRGFKTAHFIMQYNDIKNSKVGHPYKPELGEFDNKVRPEPGTSIIMRQFHRRRVPDMEMFLRQLAQRFGGQFEKWRIRLIDTKLASSDKDREKFVDRFHITTMPQTKIVLKGPTTEAIEENRQREFSVVDEENKPIEDIKAGFLFEGKKFYPVTGWAAYAKNPYSDELMAGVRIYCRGKIAAQTPLFDHKAGFTGEHSIRSYLVGELHADWLDQDDDLIQTDRRDILWSSELGQQFEKWGQDLVKFMGRRSRGPERKRVWEEFLETSDAERQIEKAYPGENFKNIRTRALGIVRALAERLRHSEARDRNYAQSLVQQGIAFGPHMVLDDALKQAANEEGDVVAVMAAILRTARIAELASYGMIAEERVNVIEKLTRLLADDKAPEEDLQNLITEAPWLLNPMWSPLTENRQLSTLKDEFEKFFREETGQKITLGGFTDAAKARRPDFVLSSDDFGIQIIEIKKRRHVIKNKEWDRIEIYIEEMRKFLEANNEFREIFKGFRVVLVCDKIGLTGAHLTAFSGLKKSKDLEHITWSIFLRRTKHMHMVFLKEAERQRKLAAET